ncbi:MAG TPA: hypothetical protein VE753_06570 [Gaiellaceae bacterium]|jgi:hypothetical protein|nr:hypothetical protein [Gaiellaceae bacterium]
MPTAPVPVRVRWTALVAGAIALGMDVAYVLLLRSAGEGDIHRARPQLIAASLAASAGIALGGSLVRAPRLRLGLLAAASFTLLAWGFVGMFTIGLPVFVAGVLVLFSTGRTAAEMSTAEAFAVTAVAGTVAARRRGVILAAAS